MAVELVQRRFGDDGSLVLIVHGLLGQARNWQAIAKRLAAGRRVVTVDLRNHGHSPWDQRMDYAAMALDLAAVVGAAGADRAAVIGHSMGGKVAMILALSRPDLVERLAVVDVAPVAYDHQDYAGYIRGMLEIDLERAGRRAEVEAALERVDPDPRVRAFLASNLEVGPDGSRWLPNLRVLLEALPAILDFPDPGQSRFTGPALFLTGGESSYVPDAARPLIERLFPTARIESIDGAGHWVHADRPKEILDSLTRFLEDG